MRASRHLNKKLIRDFLIILEHPTAQCPVNGKVQLGQMNGWMQEKGQLECPLFRQKIVPAEFWFYGIHDTE